MVHFILHHIVLLAVVGVGVIAASHFGLSLSIKADLQRIKDIFEADKAVVVAKVSATPVTEVKKVYAYCSQCAKQVWDWTLEVEGVVCADCKKKLEAMVKAKL